MNSIILFLLLIPLTIPSLLKAETPTNFYIVWRGSVTQANIDTLKNYKRSDKNQPLRTQVNVITCPNTDYLLVSITTQTTTENNFVKLAESQGKILLIQSVWGLESKTDSRTGGLIYDTWIEKVNPIPSECNRKWEVEQSTP